MNAQSSRFRPYFEKAASGAALTEAEAAEAFHCIMCGEAPDIELASFLVALRARGETVDEIAGAVSAMRRLMMRVEAPDGAMDVVGTGGDARGTYNISTATALVVAAAGVPVAKHGNRAISSKSGAADVLECLGVKIGLSVAQAEACLRQAGIVFLFAPNHHPAMRFAGPVRAALKLRTIFNLLGPLANPAETKRQVVGVFSPDWLMPMAEALLRLGAERAWVVHGAGGLDELSTLGPTQVVEVKDGGLRRFEVSPAEAGLECASMADLMGGAPADNAEALRAVLKGKPDLYRDIVLLNAAAALIVAGRADDLAEGAELARATIASGAAEAALEKLIEIGSAFAADAESEPARPNPPLAALVQGS